MWEGAHIGWPLMDYMWGVTDTGWLPTALTSVAIATGWPLMGRISEMGIQIRPTTTKPSRRLSRDPPRLVYYLCPHKDAINLHAFLRSFTRRVFLRGAVKT